MHFRRIAPQSRRFAHAGLLLAALLLPVSPVLAAPLDLALGFATLPSAQGFTYVASGAHAGVPEASVFSVNSVRLIQNTMGQSNGVSGGSIFYQRLNGITTTETKRIAVTARCLAAEGSTNAPSGEGGFIFGFATGSVQYAFGLTPTRISVLQPGGTVLLSGTFDNATAFHDYIFEWTPPSSWRVIRDGVVVGTGSGGFSVASNRVFLGDGTGGANARGEISMFRFSQDVVTAVRSETWARMKALFH
jgi:hypothetical protein